MIREMHQADFSDQKSLTLSLRLRCSTVLLPLLSALLGVPAVQAQEPEGPALLPQASKFEGVYGLTLGYRPEYSGSSNQVVKLTPGLFIRYGRFTLSNVSGFVTRRADDVVRGLGVDLLSSDRIRLSLALRVDGGRSESTSTALKGQGDIKPTVRARAATTWKFDGPWRLGAAWSVDALGRGGGNFGDVSAGWEHPFGHGSALSLGTSLSLAGDRYMQTYYGISAEQAARSGRAEYTPGAGLRDLSVSANLRHDLGPDWTVLAGASASHLLGPAAASPLTANRNNWGISTSLGRRF
jgi:outer membrane scaffolding protein for murein synthesis (MipA/OmpV family)